MTQPQITFNVKGIGEAVRRLEPVRYTRALRVAMNRVGELYKTTLADHTPRQSGHLANSWGFKVQKAGRGLFLRITNPVPYGVFVNFGTGVHIGKGLIRPVRASVMVFRMGGSLVFARSTRGQPGQRFVEEGSEAAAQRMPNVIRRAVQRTLDGRKP